MFFRFFYQRTFESTLIKKSEKQGYNVLPTYLGICKVNIKIVYNKELDSMESLTVNNAQIKHVFICPSLICALA